MSRLPVPMDDNLNRLLDRWTEIYTTRFTSVDATTGQAVSLTPDIKEIAIHIEGNTEVANITGTVSGSSAAYITSDGTTWVFPVATDGSTTLFTVKAPSGSTIDVSVIAGR
jgi:hypothetical protein